VARGLHTLLAVAALYLLLSPLALAAFKGREAPASFQQPAQPFYDPEYASPPPAEVASFSLEAAKIVPLGSSGSKQCFELRMAVSALEYGPFTTGWLAYYPNGYEWVWCCSSFNGPGLVYLNVTSACVEEGYASFGFPLYVSKGGGTAWVQSIDILGSDMPLDKARIIKCLCLPSIKDVAVEEHRDLGGIVIRVTLHAPASWSTFRLRVYYGNRLIYDFMKRVSIPEKWESSPIDLRADFGPIQLKKAGTYTIQVDVASGGVTDSKVVMYEKQPETGPAPPPSVSNLSTEISLRTYIAEYRSGHVVLEIAFGIAFDSPLEMGKKVRVSQVFVPYLGFYPYNTSLYPHEVPEEVREYTEAVLEVGEVWFGLEIVRERGAEGLFSVVLVKNWSGKGFPFWNFEWLQGREIEIPYYPDGKYILGTIMVYGLKVKFRDGQVFEQPSTVWYSSGFVKIPFNQPGKYSSKFSIHVVDVMWYPRVETSAHLEVQPDLTTVKGSLSFKWIGISDEELQVKWRFILSSWERISKRLEDWLACTQGVELGSIRVESFTIDALQKSLHVYFVAQNLLKANASEVTLTLLNPFTGRFYIPPEKSWDLAWLYITGGVFKPYFFSGTVTIALPADTKDTRYLLLSFSPTTGIREGNTVTWRGQAVNSYSIKFKVQYYLAASSPYGTVEGEGWYDNGSYATVKLTVTDVDAGLVTYRFERWEGLEPGDVVVERGTVKVLVNKPRSLVAVWREDYTRAYLLLGLLLAAGAAAAFTVKARKRASGAR